MKYKVGDTVKFRDDLVIGRYYGFITFLSGMQNLRGKTAVIMHIDGNYFDVCGSPFWYSLEMLDDEPFCDPVSLDVSDIL